MNLKLKRNEYFFLFYIFRFLKSLNEEEEKKFFGIPMNEEISKILG